MRSYDEEIRSPLFLVRSGAPDQALERLERQNRPIFSIGVPDTSGIDKTADEASEELSVQDSLFGKDLLYYLEKGEIQRLQNDVAQSRDSWLKADEIVCAWEDEYRANPVKMIGEIGAFLINDRVRRYDGQDYEKVFLSTRQALNHILLGNFDHARVEMQKTFEREKLIEAFREKEYDRARDEHEKIDVWSEDLEQHGYPMSELDTPEVRALKNGFQNAFAHYLAGYFFEMIGENSLAAPGYRNALALAPNSRLIPEKLAMIGGKQPATGEADVLFVLESGFAPAKQSLPISLPVRINRNWVTVTLSFPLLQSEKSDMPTEIRIGKTAFPVETLVDVDALARRALKDQFPGIIGRTVARAVAKSALQYQAEKHENALAYLVAALFSVITEQADERSWRTLPNRLGIARTRLPGGKLLIEVPLGSDAVFQNVVTIDPRRIMNVILIRIIDRTVYLSGPEATKTPGALDENGSDTPVPKPEPLSVLEVPFGVKSRNASSGKAFL